MDYLNRFLGQRLIFTWASSTLFFLRAREQSLKFPDGLVALGPVSDRGQAGIKPSIYRIPSAVTMGRSSVAQASDLEPDNISVRRRNLLDCAS